MRGALTPFHASVPFETIRTATGNTHDAGIILVKPTAVATVNRNLIYEALTDAQLPISYQNANFPSDQEWESWLSAANSHHHQKKVFRLPVMTAGGHPTKS